MQTFFNFADSVVVGAFDVMKNCHTGPVSSTFILMSKIADLALNVFALVATFKLPGLLLSSFTAIPVIPATAATVAISVPIMVVAWFFAGKKFFESGLCCVHIYNRYTATNETKTNNTTTEVQNDNLQIPPTTDQRPACDVEIDS